MIGWALYIAVFVGIPNWFIWNAGAPALVVGATILSSLGFVAVVAQAARLFESVDNYLKNKDSGVKTEVNFYSQSYEQYITKVYPKQPRHEGTETTVQLPDGTVKTTRNVTRWD